MSSTTASEVTALTAASYIELDESDIAEIEHRYGRGDDVYWGELSDSGDDGGLAEAFFSHECFVVIGDDIYFNARNSIY